MIKRMTGWRSLPKERSSWCHSQNNTSGTPFEQRSSMAMPINSEEACDILDARESWSRYFLSLTSFFYCKFLHTWNEKIVEDHRLYCFYLICCYPSLIIMERRSKRAEFQSFCLKVASSSKVGVWSILCTARERGELTVPGVTCGS